MTRVPAFEQEPSIELAAPLEHDLLPWGHAYETTWEVKARMRLYELLVKDKTDIFQLGLDDLHLTGTETGLDIGCSDNLDMINLRKHRGHTGRLIGMDTNPDLFFGGIAKIKQEGIQPVEFKVGRAEDIPLPDNSVDFVIAKYVLYHTEPELALREIRRVLKDDGQLLVVTVGEGNIPVHRYFEWWIAKNRFDAEPPPKTSKNFTIEVADQMLPKLWNIKSRHRKIAQISIETEEDIRVYLDSLSTRKNSFKPIPQSSVWLDVEEENAEQIRWKIKTEGSLVDWMDHCAYVCTPKKQTV